MSKGELSGTELEHILQLRPQLPRAKNGNKNTGILMGGRNNHTMQEFLQSGPFA